MAQHRLTETWTILLPEDGEGAPTESGDLVVNADGRQIVVATWDAPEGVPPQAQLEALKSAPRPAPRAEFDERGPDGTLRWAFLLDEQDDDHEYRGLYGYVLDTTEWLQVAVLFDDPRDHDEALMIWRSVRHSAPS